MQTPNPSSVLIAFKIIGGFEYVNFAQIIRIEADRKNTLIFVKNEEKAIRCVLPISVIEEMLPPLFF